ncbi:galectin-10-like isoform X2 [Myotis daubentonii]|uniref:galectin-10-like isoform X2 n=1 Tax=Myotis daubentonii TaxID=98922 RepID=UPI0028738111|nr:galectin-10-like isoform X2 [Myotis daubentonii]
METLPVPYTKHMSLPVGSFLKIKGTPTMSFSKNPQLQVDFHTEHKDDSDIAFHFRVYFNSCVVMNSRQCGNWKEEVKTSVMPFKDGQPFELGILVLPKEYQEHSRLGSVVRALACTLEVLRFNSPSSPCI